MFCNVVWREEEMLLSYEKQQFTGMFSTTSPFFFSVVWQWLDSSSTVSLTGTRLPPALALSPAWTSPPAPEEALDPPSGVNEIQKRLNAMTRRHRFRIRLDCSRPRATNHQAQDLQ